MSTSLSAWTVKLLEETHQRYVYFTTLLYALYFTDKVTLQGKVIRHSFPTTQPYGLILKTQKKMLLQAAFELADGETVLLSKYCKFSIAKKLLMKLFIS